MDHTIRNPTSIEAYVTIEGPPREKQAHCRRMSCVPFGRQHLSEPLVTLAITLCASLEPIVHRLYRILFCVLIVAPGCSSYGQSRLKHYQQGGAYSGGGPSICFVGRQILYSSPRTGNGDIYKVNLEGTTTVRLTNDDHLECDADCSPDGKVIVFVLDGDDGGRLWLMESNGTKRRQLSHGKGDEGSPRFSPDGRHVVFWRTVVELSNDVGISRAREVFLIEVATGDEERLTNNKLEDVFPMMAPDGQRLTITRENHIWIMNWDGGDAQALGPGGQASFSSDGKQLTFVAGRYGRRIDVMNVDGSDCRTIYSRNTTVSHPVFIEDDQAILFLEEPEGRGVGTIMMVNLKENAVKRVTDTR